MGEFNRSIKDFEDIDVLKKRQLQYIIRQDDGLIRFFAILTKLEFSLKLSLS